VRKKIERGYRTMIVIQHVRQMLILCAALSLFPFPLAGADLGFQISPYVQNVSKTSAAIYWKSTNKATGRVEYGPTEAYGASAGGHIKYIMENGSPQPQEGSVTQAHLDDLAPDTLYHYRIKLSTSSSKDRTFRTAPHDNDAAFTFLVYGDSRSDPVAHARVVSAAATTCDAAFVLHTGDVVPSGSAGQSIWTKQFFGPADPLLRETWFSVIRGNHDNANPLFFLYFEGTDSSQGEAYFSFDWGPVHVVTLDTNSAYDPGSKQYRFLKRDLAETSRPFRVFFGHHPAYSSGSHGSTKRMQDYLQPLFEQNGVQLVFAGHDHTYERTIINGITYVVSGGGGAPLYGQGQLRGNPKSLVFREIYNFVQVDVTSEKLTLTAWAVNNSGVPTIADQAVIAR
jgi:acid phosphatase type 7